MPSKPRFVKTRMDRPRQTNELPRCSVCNVVCANQDDLTIHLHNHRPWIRGTA